MTDKIEPGDLVQLAGWPAATALQVLAIHGDQVQMQAGNMKITAHRSSVTTVHRVARQVQA